jgi:hypothetical protein
MPLMGWKPKGLIFLGFKGFPTPNHATQLFAPLYSSGKKIFLTHFLMEFTIKITKFHV